MMRKKRVVSIGTVACLLLGIIFSSNMQIQAEVMTRQHILEDDASKRVISQSDVSFEIIPKQTEYHVGDDIAVTIRATNVSDKDIYVYASTTSYEASGCITAKMVSADGKSTVKDNYYMIPTDCAEYYGTMKPGESIERDYVFNTKDIAEGSYLIDVSLGSTDDQKNSYEQYTSSYQVNLKDDAQEDAQEDEQEDVVSEDDVSFEIIPKQTEYHVGDEIAVTIRATNVSDKDIYVCASTTSYGASGCITAKMVSADGKSTVKDNYYGIPVDDAMYYGTLKSGESVQRDYVFDTKDIAEGAYQIEAALTYTDEQHQKYCDSLNASYKIMLQESKETGDEYRSLDGARTILKTALKIFNEKAFSEDQINAMDMNKDQTITIEDAQLALKYALNIIK